MSKASKLLYKELKKESKADRQASNFRDDLNAKTVQGHYLEGLRSKKGRLKWLKIATDKGEIVVKVAKDVANDLPAQIQSGDELKIWLTRKDSYLKATQIVPLSINNRNVAEIEFPDALELDQASKSAPQIKLKVCRKGTCCKRGSLQVIQAMEAAIAKHELEDRITIETTGCMDRCKKGPNIKVVPNGEWYDRVQVGAAEDIIKELQIGE
jgi:(2Fe-2S) ferredoxin